ncbi:MAG: hypothetical protein ACLFRX_11455, partial [Gemmatimonadota bacterium]
MTATRRRLAGILLSFFLLTVSPALAQHASAIRPAEADLAAATATITPEDSRARVAFLSDDALLGRDTPSPGLDAALAYTAAEFLRMGLQPAGDDGTWLQRYPWVRWRVRPEAARLTVAAGGPTAFVDGAGLAVMPAETGFAGEPVIVGAVTGEAVRLEGIAGQVPVAFVAGPLDREANQRLAVAVRSAEAAGAAGMILVLDSVVGPARMERLA